MRALLEKVLNLGTKAVPSSERPYVVFTNEAALLVSVISLTAGLSSISAHHPLIRDLIWVQAVGFAAVPLLMASGRTLAVSLYFGIFAAFTLALLALWSGPASGQSLELITVVLGAWFVFPPTRRYATYFVAGLAIVLFWALEILRPVQLALTTEAQALAARTVNEIVLLIIVLVFAVYAVRRSQKAEAQLELAHRKSEDLLRNILPVAIAERLKEAPTAIAERFEEATILFADIVSFTQLAERTPPDALVKMLDEVFTRFDTLAGRFELEKIKTIGDAYMAACGIPEPRRDHVERVASMALEMLRVIHELPEGPLRQLELRIGIHTGPVIAGVIGQRRFAYDLWGDSVNTASRMESHGQPGRIQVSAAVYERLRDTFVFEKRGPIQVKGKGELEAYFLLGRRAPSRAVG